MGHHTGHTIQQEMKDKMAHGINYIKDYVYPYKGLNDPAFIKRKHECFIKNGHGWWWGDGWWNGHTETSMERNKKYRESRR